MRGPGYGHTEALSSAWRASPRKIPTVALPVWRMKEKASAQDPQTRFSAQRFIYPRRAEGRELETKKTEDEGGDRCGI